MPAADSFFHVVLSSDSLSFPRPWNAKLQNQRPEEFFRFRDTYPYLLEMMLRRALPKSDVQISNLGQRGVTMAAAAARCHDFLQWFEPSAAIVHLGIVDCWDRVGEAKRFRLPLDLYESNTETILKTHQQLAPGLPLIFIGILPTNAATLVKLPEQNKFIADYNEKLRTLTAGRALFIDVERQFAPMLEQVVHLDGHHLSRLGHQLYAEELFRMIMLSMKWVPVAPAPHLLADPP